MAASQPAQTKTNHPVLGPAIAIDDDTRRTKLRLIFEICMVPLGLFGPSWVEGTWRPETRYWGCRTPPAVS